MNDVGEGRATACDLRPASTRARGREYSIVIVVPSTVCETEPFSLASCARMSEGTSASPNPNPNLITGTRSAKLRVDRGSNLVEALALLVQAVGEAPFALTDLAMAGHALRLVARQ